MKRGIALAGIGVLLALTPAAPADSWQGTVTAGETALLTAPASGRLEALDLTVGQTVTAGEALGSVRETRVFAPADGTVAAVHVKEGDTAGGTVVEISPVSRYTVTCTVTGVAASPEEALIHLGETVWLRCTADGSHRAAGFVCALDGTSFTVETTAGDLYIGETVWACREEACSAASRVGKGTVTAADTLTVSGEGTVLRLRVQPGDAVARGQWLFSTADAAETEASAPAAGVVTRLLRQTGDTVTKDEALAEIAVSRVLRISIPAEESLSVKPGQRWTYTRADDPHETRREARVLRILRPTEGEAEATVELVPAEEDLPLGLAVTVYSD